MDGKTYGAAGPPTSQFIPPAAAGGSPLSQKVGQERILEGIRILQEYKAGKAILDARVTEDELWFKLRHWDTIKKPMDPNNPGKASPERVKPASAWLFNSIANKHADAMDSFPAPNILPREESDQAEAKVLSDVIPVLLEQAGFEGVYSDVMWQKLKFGTGIYGVFWDNSAAHGLGDITIKETDIHNIFWEPGIKDIQQSRNVFVVDLVDNDLLAQRYPELGDMTPDGDNIQPSRFVYDENIDTSKKTAVVDWYYKTYEGGKPILHFIKFAGVRCLFATENEPEEYPQGWYTHGLYPFVFDPLYVIEGTPCGMGLIDIGKNTQEYIDRMDQGIVKNVLANAKPRYFVNSASKIKVEDFANLDNEIINVEGTLDDTAVRPVTATAFSSLFISHLQNKVAEIKETTGNRDVSTGGTTSGVTAASAIAALQEAGSKLSRDSNKASYRSFREVVNLVIELIRQFYSIPRFFRILGPAGTMNFIQLSNAGLIPQYQGVVAGVDMGYRMPVFDIEVTAEKQSPYSKMAQNELALEFYKAGFFNPLMAPQALAVLQMMDFDHKEEVIQTIMTYSAGMIMPQPVPGEGAGGEEPPPTGGESPITAKARAESRDGPAPR